MHPMTKRHILAFAAATLCAAIPTTLRAQQPVRSFELISTSTQSQGYTADGHSDAPAVDLSGRFVAFYSDAKELDSLSGRYDKFTYRDVFVRDRVTGLTEHVSVGADGSEANGNSPATQASPSISADGCLVAFSSDAWNLLPADTDGVEDVFVRNRCSDPKTTELIAPGNSPAISGDGRFVVYQLNGTIFLYDRLSTESRGISDSVGLSGAALTPAISGDGNVVAFAFQATGSPQQVYVRDLGPAGDRTEMVSVTNALAPGNGASYRPALNFDGSSVAFKSDASNLVDPRDTNGVSDTFVRDRRAATTTLVSIDRCGNHAQGRSAHPGISGDGRFVAFPTFDDFLDATDTDRNDQSDMYLHDRDADGNGIFDEAAPDNCPTTLTTDTVRISIEYSTRKSDAGVSENPPSISGNGKWIAFASASSELVPKDENFDADVFVACNPLKQPCPPECLGSEQCQDGKVCLPDDNTCVTPTPTNTPTDTPTPTQTPTPPETPCTTTCPPGLVCVDGRCVTPTVTPTHGNGNGGGGGGGGGGGCSCDIDPTSRRSRVPSGLALLAPAVLVWLRRRALAPRGMQR